MSDRHYGGPGSSYYRSGGGYRGGNSRGGREGSSQYRGGHQSSSRSELGDYDVNSAGYEGRMDAKSRRGGEIGHEYPNKRSMGVAGTNASPHVYSQAYQQYDAQTHSYVPTSAYNGAYATGISPFNGLASNLGASQSWSHSTMPSDPTSPASGVAYSYYPTYGTEFALPAAATEKLASGEYYDPLAPPEQPRPKALPQNVVKTSHDSTKTGIGSHIRSPVAKVASSGVSASTTSSGAHIRELKDNERSKATPINKAPGALVFFVRIFASYATA